jgi:hypothetical protein
VAAERRIAADELELIADVAAWNVEILAIVQEIARHGMRLSFALDVRQAGPARDAGSALGDLSSGLRNAPEPQESRNQLRAPHRLPVRARGREATRHARAQVESDDYAFYE